jgi:HSP20 family protein
VLRFDLPGVSLEDVDITLEDHTLTVSGVRKGVAEEAPHYLLELPYGAFRRSVTVPEGSDPDSIKATYRDGVLQSAARRDRRGRAEEDSYRNSVKPR